MIEKPDPSDFVLWRRAACTQWLLEQIAAQFDHSRDWQYADSFDKILEMRGHQQIVDFIHRET